MQKVTPIIIQTSFNCPQRRLKLKLKMGVKSKKTGVTTGKASVGGARRRVVRLRHRHTCACKGGEGYEVNMFNTIQNLSVGCTTQVKV